MGHLIKHGLEAHESPEDSNKPGLEGHFGPLQKLKTIFLGEVFARGKTQTRSVRALRAQETKVWRACWGVFLWFLDLMVGGP